MPGKRSVNAERCNAGFLVRHVIADFNTIFQRNHNAALRRSTSHFGRVARSLDCHLNRPHRRLQGLRAPGRARSRVSAGMDRGGGRNCYVTSPAFAGSADPNPGTISNAPLGNPFSAASTQPVYNTLGVALSYQVTGWGAHAVEVVKVTWRKPVG